MTRPIVRIYTEPNVYIDREMNDKEFEQHLKDVAEYEADQAARKAEAEAKAQAKATAESKLAALGLTTDDLRALGL
jgi:hypothetical protein